MFASELLTSDMSTVRFEILAKYILFAVVGHLYVTETQYSITYVSHFKVVHSLHI